MYKQISVSELYRPKIILQQHLKKEWEKLGNPKAKSVTGDMYSFMSTKYAVRAVTKLYGQRAVWQDDPVTIQHTEAALEAWSAFVSRIPHEEQALEMADTWPVENILSFVKEMLKSKEPKNKAQLKTIITRVWGQQWHGVMQEVDAEHPRQAWRCNCQGGQAS